MNLSLPIFMSFLVLMCFLSKRIIQFGFTREFLGTHWGDAYRAFQCALVLRNNTVHLRKFKTSMVYYNQHLGTIVCRGACIVGGRSRSGRRDTTRRMVVEAS